MQYLGAGRGAYERDIVKTYTGYRCRPFCWLLPLLLIPIGFLIWHYWPRPAQNPIPTGPDCETGYHDYENLWTEQRQAYCCKYAGRACGQAPRVIHQIVHVPVVEKGRNHYVPVPVPTPPHVVYKTHVVQLPPKIVYQHDETHYDCHAGYSNWYFGWSDRKKSWCCDRRSMGCPGTWHGSYHIHTHVMAHGVGHAQGRIYDCDAGFSRWMTGWSDSKKDWCCNHQSRGCVKFHCTAGGEDTWAADKRSWCCENFQKGCPHTTLSALKCQASCTHAGETSKCIDRIHWTKEHVFGNKANGCELAYSKVQVECDICRACSIQDGRAVKSM
ncbi:unnamed protein product, partial [Durusdinium trenchii]